MRHIDIKGLNIDANWQKGADHALGDIRKAEPADRSKIINKYQSIWKDLKDKLSELSDRKCWYSESKNSGSDNVVDHFRPKGNVKNADPEHDGYWWLAFDWKNFRFSCTLCNERRINVDGSRGGKHDYFPLLNGADRARDEADFDDEIPLLIDPTEMKDLWLLGFTEDGMVEPVVNKKDDKLGYMKADKSIELYHLNHYRLKEARAILLKNVRECAEDVIYTAKRYYKIKGIDNLRALEISRVLEIRMNALRKAIDPTAEFSMAARYVLVGMSGNSEYIKAVLNYI